MNKILIILMLLSLRMIVFAQDNPTAFLKAEYESYEINNRGTEKEKTYLRTLILQIGKGTSYWYDPQTFFIDSLENDPVGSKTLDDVFDYAIKRSKETGQSYFDIQKTMGYVRGDRTKLQKFFDKGSIRVWNSNSPDYYQYDVPMDELVWEVGDSTSNILGYECYLATADYHGRKWNAWFAPDVPVQDGPWQLCGLPGLILKADTEDGLFGFVAKGLQQCDEPFKEKYIRESRLFYSKRKSFWKTKDYARRNRNAYISAMTNGAVNPKNANYTGTDDFIECDYHD